MHVLLLRAAPLLVGRGVVALRSLFGLLLFFRVLRTATLKPTIVSQVSSRRLLVFLRRTSAFDRIALGILVLYLIFRLFALAGMRLPFTGLLFFLSFISGIYFVVRLMPWVRNYLLWRLRNRLIVAYVLIAVVPVVLLLGMAGLAAYGLYLQLGAHLLHDALQERVSMVAGDGEAIASAIEDEANRGAAPHDDAILRRPEVEVLIAAAQREWPDVRVLAQSRTTPGWRGRRSRILRDH